MTIEIRAPQLPESVEDATVAVWHKQPGDTVRRDENLMDLETDKVVLEVPAPADGVLQSHAVEQGAVVHAGDLLGVLDEQGTAGVSEGVSAGKEAPSPAAATPQPSPEEQPAQATPPPASTRRDKEGGAPMGPAARHHVEAQNLDAGEIAGTGPGGRITKADVLEHASGRAAASSAAVAQQRAPAAQPAAVAAAPSSGGRPEERVPMSRLRARIAERLVEAQHTAAMLTTFNEVDLEAANTLRHRYREIFEKKHGVRLGLMSFFVRACVQALQRYPMVNASIDGKDVIYHGFYDIGIAVASPRGLVVPILRDADTMNFAEIEKQIQSLAEKARAGSLSLDELSGGTFSITNGGVFGSMMSTPILNPPQSAILGMHAVKERPVVVDGQIVIRPMMYLALSYDHRLIDGKEAVQFLVTVKELLEDPARLLLAI